MPFPARGPLFASLLSLGVLAAAAYPASALAAPAAAAAAPSTRGVIVMLRNQHSDLSGTRSARVQAEKQDQAPLIAKAKNAGVADLKAFTSVNAFAGTATSAQIAQLAADPSVAAVYPDLAITKPVAPDAEKTTTASAAGTSAASSKACPSDPSKPILEPEALQTTNTAFQDPKTASAQQLATGAGVKVAWLADGIDIDNPDFIRADGSHVFTDYQDFSGEGPDAPSSSVEAFGDASSIAAQGRQVYDVADYVAPTRGLPAGCTITIRGMAPGASMVGLKVFGNAPTAPTSRFIQAIDYAVNVAGVDVINESFGANPYPDLGNDPITLADEAAVDAGVTVVASTGDSGTNGTIGSPASSDKVIAVAATTTFRTYFQTGFAGANVFSNGTWANGNISGLSSGGVTQRGKVPDLAAPGDEGWVLCSPNTDIYLDCANEKGEGTSFTTFGGTSESAPLTSGAAALVIEAYKKTHHGVRPAPALVKRLLTGTATDLGHPASEQGAGQLNSLAAVKAAMSWQDGNGKPAAQGSALVVDKTQLLAVGQPGSTVKSAVNVTNVSANTQTVRLTTRTLDKKLSDVKGTVRLDTATAPTYTDVAGIVRSYVKQTFTVPVGADRLDASIAGVAPTAPLRIILVDPHGTFQAYSIPQGVNNFAHVDVRYPGPGTWSAYFGVSKATGVNLPVQYEFTTSDYVSLGTVSPSSVTLAPGATKSVTVSTKMPANPGDKSSSVQLSTPLGVTSSVPLVTRTLVPTAGKTNTFTGTLTGGNGRSTPAAQTNSYYLDVPAGKKDLDLSIALAKDPGTYYEATLTAPDGQVYSYQSNGSIDADGNLVTGKALQLYRRNPEKGRWLLSLDFTNPVSGLATSQPFTGKLTFDAVKVQASLPNGSTLKAGKAVTVPVKITNTGDAPLTYFADGRLGTVGTLPLVELSGNATDIPLPVPAGVNPFWVVPPDSTGAVFQASADQPVNLDMFTYSGQPEVYSAAQGNGAVVRVEAPQVSPGIWMADIGQSGPFTGPATPGSVSVFAQAQGQLFDPALTSSTGDIWQGAVDSGANATLAKAAKNAMTRRLTGTASSSAASAASSAAAGSSAAAPTGPVTLAPGKSTTITVTITPSGAKGSTVRGHLYVDTWSDVTSTGDELVDLPYSYKIG